MAESPPCLRVNNIPYSWDADVGCGHCGHHHNPSAEYLLAVNSGAMKLQPCPTTSTMSAQAHLGNLFLFPACLLTTSQPRALL